MKINASFSDNDSVNNSNDEGYINPLDEYKDQEESSNQENEEQNIKEELEELELGKLLQAKIKLQKHTSLNLNNKSVKLDKKKIEQTLLARNKSKSKAEPKEFSALIRPKKAFPTPNASNSTNIRRDPRFDNLSGELNVDEYNKNFSFVQDQAKQYVDKLKNLQKNNKKRNNVDDEQFELMKKQVNFVKGWVKSKEYQKTKDNVKKEFKEENKERKSKGLNPVYVKNSVMKKLVEKTQIEKRSEQETKRYLKRKQHREVVKIKKNELR